MSAPAIPGKSNEIAINPGSVLVINHSRVNGGRESKREALGPPDAEGNKITTTATVTHTIFDVKEDKEARELFARTTSTIRKFCVSTPIGYLCDASKLPEIARAFDTMRIEAGHFNADAKTCSVEVSMIPLQISVAMGPESVRAIANHVRETLEGMKTAIIAGDHAKIRNTILPATGGNLPQLATGMLRQAIEFAIDEVKDAHAKIKRATTTTKDRQIAETPESAGRPYEAPGALPMLDAAIDAFRI